MTDVGLILGLIAIFLGVVVVGVSLFWIWHSPVPVRKYRKYKQQQKAEEHFRQTNRFRDHL